MGHSNSSVILPPVKQGRAKLSPAKVSVSYNKWLVAILTVGTLFRLGSAIYQGNAVSELPGIWDQISYDGLARRIVQGYGFSFGEDHWPATAANQPTAHWSYLYTLYLAAIYAVFGVQPIVARLVQAVIAGVLHIWLTWRIGRRVFGRMTGLVAASLCAGYVYFFYYAGALLTETFYFVGILWVIDVSLRLNRNSPPANSVAYLLWVELGFAIAVTGLLRQVFLIFAPFLFLWLWWSIHARESSSPQGAKSPHGHLWEALQGTILSGLVIVMLICPWTVRNYEAFGTFVPLNTSAGFALYWGNHPIYGTHFVSLLPGNWTTYTGLIPAELRSLNEGELDRALFKEGLKFIVDDPGRFLLLSISRIREYFKFWPSASSGIMSNVSRMASFAVCLPFMLYGVWVSFSFIRRSRSPNQRAEIVLLYLFVAVYSGIHLTSWALIRYRLPVDTVLLIFAAIGFLDTAHRFEFLKPGIGKFVKNPGADSPPSPH
jgi:hypothetical protein